MENVVNSIKLVIIEQLELKKESISEELRFMEDLGADVLDFIALIEALEEKFEIQISNENMEKIKTVGDVIRYIEKTRNS